MKFKKQVFRIDWIQRWATLNLNSQTCKVNLQVWLFNEILGASVGGVVPAHATTLLFNRVAV